MGVTQRVLDFGASFLDEAAEDWSISRKAATAIFFAPAVLSLVTIAAAVLHRPTFDALTSEDQIGEWIQALAWVVGLFYAVRVTRRLLRNDQRWLAGAYAVLAVGIAFIIAEEISWGQRLIGFDTPPELEAANAQGEVTIHNLEVLDSLFEWGMFTVGFYGTATILGAARRWGGWAHWPALTKSLVPHPLLLPGFLLLLVWRIYRNLFEPPKEIYVGVSEFGETTELVLALAFAAFLWHQWSSRHQVDDLGERSARRLAEPSG